MIKSYRDPANEMCQIVEEEIDDTSFFNMIDNQIRNTFAAWEVKHCLPAAHRVMHKNGLLKEFREKYPVEGYYTKSPELRELFNLIRNFQQNENWYKNIQPGEDLDFLKSIYEDNEVMGTEPTEFYPWPDAPIKRRYDILTITLQDKEAFDEHATFPWAIDTIVAAVEKHRRGIPNLVELASLIGNPECLCAGAETNALSRMYGIMSGSWSAHSTRYIFIWKVSPKVAEFGARVVAGYNRLMNNFDIVVPTSENAVQFKRSFERPRVAHMGYLTESGLNYFWIMDLFDNIPMMEIYTRNFITSETFLDNATSIRKTVETGQKIWYK